MGVNVSVTGECAVGNEIEVMGVFDLGNYVTGGVKFTSKDFKLSTLRTVDFPALVSDGSTQRFFCVVWSGDKRFMAFSTSFTEAADGSPLQGFWMHFRARGVK